MIELQSRMLGLKTAELNDFGVKMKWLNMSRQPKKEKGNLNCLKSFVLLSKTKQASVRERGSASREN